MEPVGLLLAVLGLIFAFERPRNWVVSIFRLREAIEHFLGMRLHLETHNNGKQLDLLGNNKQERFLVFYWHVRNKNDQTLQFVRAVAVRQKDKAKPIVNLVLTQCTDHLTLATKPST